MHVNGILLTILIAIPSTLAQRLRENWPPCLSPPHVDDPHQFCYDRRKEGIRITARDMPQDTDLDGACDPSLDNCKGATSRCLTADPSTVKEPLYHCFKPVYTKEGRGGNDETKTQVICDILGVSDCDTDQGKECILTPGRDDVDGNPTYHCWERCDVGAEERA